MHLSVKYEQELNIGSLLTASANLRCYKLRDKSAGRIFGVSRKFSMNPFYVLAAMFSGQSIFPAGDNVYSIVFPVCAKTEPGFLEMLEDLKNPKKVFEEFGHGFVAQPRFAMDYNGAKSYFSGNLDTTRTINIIFKRDCIENFYLIDGDDIYDMMQITIPVHGSLYDPADIGG